MTKRVKMGDDWNCPYSCRRRLRGINAQPHHSSSGKLGIFAIAFILIMRFDVFKRLLVGRASRYERLSLSLVFGLFGIAGTYLGVPVQNAIANSRVVGVVLGGILGGPLVGLSAGIIAGAHRYLIEMNGFTATHAA
nr:LytS/YhcK type 5TM receptor domain-containing protein [Geotalea toluenoxydans]